MNTQTLFNIFFGLAAAWLMLALWLFYNLVYRPEQDYRRAFKKWQEEKRRYKA